MIRPDLWKKKTSQSVQRKQLKTLLTSLLILFLLASCNLPRAAAGASVWIDAPLSGVNVSPGTALQIKGHAASRSGISSIDLLVNGLTVQQFPDPQIQGSMAIFNFVWVPETAGEYTLQVVAFDGHKQPSQLDMVLIRAGSPFSATPEPTLTATITLTPQASNTLPPPTQTQTNPPPTNTTTPTITLTVASSQTPTITQTATQTSTITATKTRTKTSQPSQTQENTLTATQESGPQAPAPISPTDGLLFPCISSITLQWEEIVDPLGISKYEIEVERSEDGNSWQALLGSPWSGNADTSFNLPVDCGWNYRWRVRAYNGNGTPGDFSEWAEFETMQE